MKAIQKIYSAASLAIVLLGSCNSGNEVEKKEAAKTPAVKSAAVSYQLDSVTMKGFVAYDSNSSAKRPAVIIIHEWWGLNDYVRGRAKQLAALGYVAFAADLYGDGQYAAEPEAAAKLAMPFYTNPQMAKARFDAALATVKNYSQVDTTKIAAIGYCFGGAVVLNVARLGEPLNGVVSFHGNLIGAPLDKKLLKAKVLVCHGADDQFVKPEEVALFKKQMDSIGAAYTFKQYPGATHAFTNPDATANGKKFSFPIAYNAAADSASWKDMQVFFGEIFK